MQYIAHRINTVAELSQIDNSIGVEVDLRDKDGRIIMSHDPFVNGTDFMTYLDHYKHSLLILNIKSERIEHRVLELLKTYKITDYFFLDTTFPMTHLLSQSGETNIALRFSEYEGHDTIRNMEGRVKWVWADCFSQFPLSREISNEIKKMGFKICLVSPELQGRESDIEKYATFIKEQTIHIDAICTKKKNIPIWEKSLQNKQKDTVLHEKL